MVHFNPKYERWVKPLKRSEKVRLRKELEKRKKEERFGPRYNENFTENGWRLTWEQIKEKF